ncbi:MAG: hypothetical protein HY819_12145 [Acidobacteria bacterium]|nr:hypothetical protein [Acidobacteriota bacterium]
MQEETPKPIKKSRKVQILKVILTLFLLLTTWVLVDLFGPWSTNLRKFDPIVIGKLETKMWRAYYDKKALQLYWLLVEMLRTQNNLPFWQANLNAYRAAKAAFVFKKGQKRSDYEQAIPYLIDYFNALNKIGNLKNDATLTAKLELEWWIVHRERKTYGEEALVNAIAATTGQFYKVEPNLLKDYASARTIAMLQRDVKQEAGKVTEEDWKYIEQKLIEAYSSLAKELNKEEIK